MENINRLLEHLLRPERARALDHAVGVVASAVADPTAAARATASAAGQIAGGLAEQAAEAAVERAVAFARRKFGSAHAPL